MREGLLRKGTGIGVSLLLVLLIFAVLIPSASAVKLSAGTPDDISVTAGATIIFQDVTLTIRDDEAIPVKYLTFVIYNSKNDHKEAKVRFSLEGTEISENPKGAFTVMNVTNTSNLPYHGKGNYYGYDERTGYNVTGFHHGYGYGYGYDTPDLTIVYTISYKTCEPGTYYAILSVKTSKYTYISGETIPFTVLQKPILSVYVDIIPGSWPNLINIRDHGYIFVAICGTDTFDVTKINPKTLTLSLNNEKNIVKTPFWKYQDVATPWIGSDGDGHSFGADGYLDLTLKFRVEQVLYVLKLFKHPNETLKLIVTGSLKNTEGCNSLIGHDYVQILNKSKK
jgi:hypothetical protein